MYNFNNKNYVFKKSSNRMMALTYDVRNGICYSSLTKKNSWTMPVPIEKHAQESFSACMDSKDIIHIIYQNSHGNIFYIHLDETSIVSLPMLGSKYPSPYNKYFNIMAVKNNIHCFYVLLHNNKYLLTHQTISNKEVNNPQALGYINKNNLPYAAFASGSGDIYVFFQTAATNNLQQSASSFQIGYKKYSSLNQTWEEFVPIASADLSSKSELIFDYPCVIIDNTNLIHFSYQKLVADRYELVYRQKTIEENVWSNETIIHTSVNPFENSSIICIDDRIIIFWVRNDTIYYSYSADKGNSWSKPNKYHFPVGKQLSCISYVTNDFYEVNRIILKEIPGSFISGLKLAFYDDLLSSENVSGNKDSIRSIISDNLKTFNNTLNDLIETNNSLKTEIKRLKLFNTNLLREIDKISIKINYLENQIRQRKVETSRIIETDFTGSTVHTQDKNSFDDRSTVENKTKFNPVNETELNSENAYDSESCVDETHDESDVSNNVED